MFDIFTSMDVERLKKIVSVLITYLEKVLPEAEKEKFLDEIIAIKADEIDFTMEAPDESTTGKD